MQTYGNRITVNHNIMLGKPVIAGTRITVENILRKLAEGVSFNTLLEMYPKLEATDIFACLQFAADVIANEETLNLGKAS